jgi:hypothetical protein
MNHLVTVAVSIEHYFIVAFTIARAIILQEFPHAKPVCMLCNAIFGAVKIRSLESSDNKFYWMHG